MNVNPISNSAAQIPALKQAQKSSAGASFEEQLQRTSPANVKPHAAPLNAQEQPAMLTNTEKEYFEQLFPNSAEEIRSYNPYQKDGATTTAKLGSLVDRKG